MVWFCWHGHLYGWLSMAPECHHSNQSWHKCYCVRLIASFPNVGADFLNSVFISLSGCRNPFVNTNSYLFHTQCVSQKDTLIGLKTLASNSPSATIRTAWSGWDVPAVIFLIKSLCPRISVMVTSYLLILHCPREMLMVVTFIFHFIQDTGTLEGALFHLSRLFLKCLWFLCQPPTFVDQMGMNVRLTWATCPMMTELIWVFSFATWLRFSGGFHDTCVLVENLLLARSAIFTIYQAPIYA